MEIKNILVATDFSEPSRKAVKYAQDLAKLVNANVCILHAFDYQMLETPLPYFPVNVEHNLHRYIDQGRAKARELADEIRDQIGGECEVALIEGNPKTKIVEYVKEKSPDLVVMGTHGYSGLSKLLLGSVAEYVVRNSSVPVVVVR